MSAKDPAPDRLYTVQEADEICRRQSGGSAGLALGDVILLLLYADPRPMREWGRRALLAAAGLLRVSGVEPALLGEGGTHLRGADVDDAVDELAFSNKVRISADKEGRPLEIEITPRGKASIKEKYESLPPAARKALSQNRAEWDAEPPPDINDRVHAGRGDAPLRGGARVAGPPGGKSGRRAAERTPLHGGAKDAKRQEYVDRGDRLCEDGRYDEAYAYYKQAGDPDADLHLRMAQSMSEMKLYKEALGHCMAAIRADPTRAGGYVGAGYCLDRLGDHVGALSYMRQAVQRDPSNARTYLLCGATLNKLGRHAEALSCYQRVARLDPGSMRTHQNASFSLSRLGRYEEALQQAKRAAEMVPGDPAAHARIATCLSKMGRHKEAVPAGRKAIEAAPGSVDSYLPLVTALNGLGRHEDVLELCSRAAEADALDPRPHFAMALSLRALGRHEEALGRCKKSVELAPYNMHFRTAMSQILRDLNKLDEALSHCEAVVAAEPGNLPVLSNMGGILADMGNHKMALAYLDRAIRIDPRQATPRYNRALSLQETGQLDEALGEYETVVGLDPGNAGAYNNMGAVLAALDRDGEALAHLDRAIEIDPLNAAAHLNKALSLQRLGLRREALAHFDRALELEPGSADAYVGRLSCLDALGLSDRKIGRYAGEALGPVGPGRSRGRRAAPRHAAGAAAERATRLPAPAAPGAASGGERAALVESLLGRSESPTLEYKSRDFLNMDGGRTPWAAAGKLARALCGLANTRGGDLLIGVGDGGKAEGLGYGDSRLSRKEKDRILTRVADVIVDYFGAENAVLFDCEIVEAGGLDILHCAVDRSERGPVLLEKMVDGRHSFFVRVGSTCRALAPKKMLEYVRREWFEWSPGPRRIGRPAPDRAAEVAESVSRGADPGDRGYETVDPDAGASGEHA